MNAIWDARGGMKRLGTPEAAKCVAIRFGIHLLVKAMNTRAAVDSKRTAMLIGIGAYGTNASLARSFRISDNTNMKVAVSIPDDVFVKAESLVKQLKVFLQRNL